MTDSFADGGASGVLEKALAWLRDHPDSSARTIANAIGCNDDRYVFNVLDKAAYAGRCQRGRHGSGPWLWEVPGD